MADTTPIFISILYLVPRTSSLWLIIKMGPEEISYLWAHMTYVIEALHSSNTVAVYKAYVMEG